MTPASTPNPSMIGWLIVFLVVGAACYVADRRIGTGVYRWWHDLTSKQPLAKEAEAGFIYNQRARTRFSVAVCLGVAHSALAVWHFHVSPFTQLVTFAVEVPMLMGGFYLGPICYGFWERKNPILDAVDDLEAGKASVGDVLRKGGERARDLARAHFGKDEELPDRGVAESPTHAPTKPTPTIESKRDAAVPAPAENPQELMDRFTHPKKGPGHGGNSAA